ncbi:cupin domain-containing protein [Methylocystis sp. ATCC 49242]|uniref:cupin domain-containing protein n=1 Tax=Methylocystis sp. ATCC 49242 TaxID=622637 RepID=UPI0001F8680A|nr:cupin domain-containing protein [Methylocystis sp. ATCC 49242]
MSTTNKIVFDSGSVEMQPCPINPAWIIEGAPVARNFILSRSDDGGACTLIWDCTEGVFDWYYDIDETVYVLEGSVIVRDDDRNERRLGPGDHAFFPAGSHAVWRAESYVRKVAFCRNPVPKPIMLATRIAKKLAKLAGGGGRAFDAATMFGGAQ